MQFFPLLSFQHWVLALFLGLAAVIVTCMAFGARWHGTERPDLKEVPRDLREKASHLNLISQYRRNPHGLYLILIYFGILVWVIAYYLTVGLWGGPIT
jgi:hypothetical protein